jgi:multicomponent Na+:H+ antiporter subunit G
MSEVVGLLRDGASIALVSIGLLFFVAGTAGLLRFPDVYCRLHALTKADNLGLGFLAFGLALHADEWTVRLQLVLIWLLALAAAATISHLLGRASLRGGIVPVLYENER